MAGEVILQVLEEYKRYGLGRFNARSLTGTNFDYCWVTAFI